MATEGYYINPPTVEQIKQPAPALIDAVPEPKTWLDLSLRTVMLVILIILSIFAFLNIISLGILLFVPAFWIFELLAIVSFVIDIFGVYAVWKVHPELLVVFGWAQVVIVAINIIQFIALIATFGGFGVFGILSVIVSIIFAVIVISTLYPLRRYGLALRAASVVDLNTVVVQQTEVPVVAQQNAVYAEVSVQETQSGERAIPEQATVPASAVAAPTAEIEKATI
ncbi:hypothetical protein HK100_010057 [Physocladia obscura]|uniref:Uncharacterized protein n=1 Tax=Physocladia obscura TaxID=109957 RepID=A0AAD5T5F0_9FUNG|nr:hypothetical protein HK100_010057 [Physocladia obscura]